MSDSGSPGLRIDAHRINRFSSSASSLLGANLKGGRSVGIEIFLPLCS